MKKETNHESRRKIISVEKVIDAVNKYNGNISKSAKALGCERSQIYKLMESNPELKEAIAHAREVILDEAEEALLNSIREGNITSTIFALKTLGKSRGYSQTAAKEAGWVAALKGLDLKKLSDDQLNRLEAMIKKGKDPISILLELKDNA